MAVTDKINHTLRALRGATTPATVSSFAGYPQALHKRVPTKLGSVSERAVTLAGDQLQKHMCSNLPRLGLRAFT
jgi:hypothetical protein